MTDAEIRGVLLKYFYELRHNNGGWVPPNDIMMSPSVVSLQVIGGVCQQLAEFGLIQWKSLRGNEGVAAGVAKITGKGVATFESQRSVDIDIRFPGAEKFNERGGILSPARSPLAPAPAASEALAGPGPFAQSAPLLTVKAVSSSAEAKRDELLTLKPTLWGISIDLKEAWRRLWSWWRK